jgi:hypothetical protein
MVTLNLGCVDVAYTEDGESTTTGDVAEYLEADYHVMRTFLELYEDQIGDFLADAMAGEIESITQGKPVVPLASRDVTTQLGDRVIQGQSVNGRIEEAFRDYLDKGEWRQVSGQKIEAADAGVNHRKKHPYSSKNKARAAFVDTGLYQASFRAWLDNK